MQIERSNAILSSMIANHKIATPKSATWSVIAWQTRGQHLHDGSCQQSVQLSLAYTFAAAKKLLLRIHSMKATTCAAWYLT